jgi:uncharacterized protein YcfJ
MNRQILCSLATLAATCAVSQANAQEMARVISTTPVVQAVGVPQKVCTTQAVTTNEKSGAGAVMGAIAGGAIGNALGGGSGKGLATVAGVLGGAVVGDKIEGGDPKTQNVTNCSRQMVYENRVVGYNVQYEYAGRTYSIQMPNDPGAFIPVRVTPILNAPPVVAAPVPAPAGYPAPAMPSAAPTVITPGTNAPLPSRPAN